MAITTTTTRDRNIGQRGERIPLHARLRLTTPDGKAVAPLARCTNIGLGGMRVTAAEGLPPQSIVEVEVRLPSGRLFQTRGHVVWLKTTLHPSLLGTPRGRDDDASFGIAFDDLSTQSLMPIARMLVAREDERRRARRIRRLHAIPFHA
jgi:hypothetical protein